MSSAFSAKKLKTFDIEHQAASVDIWDKKYRLKDFSGNPIDTDIDFSFMTHKNEDLIIKYMSSISGKLFLGHVGPERKTQIVYTYQPFSIGTYI